MVAGAGSALGGVPHAAPALAALAVLPVLLWIRPAGRPRTVAAGLLLASIGGWLHAGGAAARTARDCRAHLPDGARPVVTGWVSGRWSRGPTLRVEHGLGAGCRPDLNLRLPGPEGVAVGDRIVVEGRWRRWGVSTDPDHAGELRAETFTAAPGPGGGRRRGPSLAIRWRDALQIRIARLFPDHEGLVSALILARREGLAPELRESFVRGGVAHLLAISGFHVGVIAALVIATLRALGASRRRAAVLGSAVVWLYVGVIGAPDAAVRAAMILTLVGVGVVRGRPVHRVGALASALLLFAALDPEAVSRAGFQLSFAGAAGLAVLTAPVEDAFRRRLLWTRGSTLRSAVAAGVAATVATLPAVAWHFERVSLVGVPVTLVTTPLVAAALPGILAALALDFVFAPAAVLVAGSTGAALDALTSIVRVATAPDAVTVWVARPWVVAGGLGASAMAAWLAPARVPRDLRLVLGAAGCVAGLLLLPVTRHVANGSAIEIVALDVGQGDAVAIRTPRGRWALVDAGPGPPLGDASAPSRAVEALRRRGVERLDALLLTHPDLDHIGGAAGIIRGLAPALIAGPGHVRGTQAYAAGLEAAADAPGGPIPWRVLSSGDTLTLDGVRLEVVHPVAAPAPDEEPNESSLVMVLRYGGFTALLTGDAPAHVEDRIAPRVGDVDFLKVSHHGSRTSTSELLLDAVTPEVAVISVGRGNRYGHPHREVMSRLERAARTVLRTDRAGTIRVRVTSRGEWTVRSSRAGIR